MKETSHENNIAHKRPKTNPKFVDSHRFLLYVMNNCTCIVCSSDPSINRLKRIKCQMCKKNTIKCLKMIESKVTEQKKKFNWKRVSCKNHSKLNYRFHPLVHTHANGWTIFEMPDNNNNTSSISSNNNSNKKAKNTKCKIIALTIMNKAHTTQRK